MSKRKPKLYQMKRLDVSPKSHFFTEDDPIYALPFSFHFSFS